MRSFFFPRSSRQFKKQRAGFWAALRLEALEDRALPSGSPGLSGSGLALDAQPYVVAGSPTGTAADSPALHVDANAAARFAGVGSVLVTIPGAGTVLGTGTLINPRHVLTAAHVLDLNSDGKADVSAANVTFHLNLDTDAPFDTTDVRIRAQALTIHPGYTGFDNPSLNDDLAIITLPEGSVPAGVPYYTLYPDGLTNGTYIAFVGYGRSGTGAFGYSGSASAAVKRVGVNVADAFLGQDDAGQPPAREVFLFDFDGTGVYRFRNVLGGASLGNRVESTIGPGDSGGPTFVVVGDPSLPGSFRLAGVNTFGASGVAPAPYFGSLAGGINLAPYVPWINTVIGSTTSPGGSAASGTISPSPSPTARASAETSSAAAPDAGVAFSLALPRGASVPPGVAPSPTVAAAGAVRIESPMPVIATGRASRSFADPAPSGRGSTPTPLDPMPDIPEPRAAASSPAPVEPPAHSGRPVHPVAHVTEAAWSPPAPVAAALEEWAGAPAGADEQAPAPDAGEDWEGVASLAALALVCSGLWEAHARRTEDDRPAPAQRLSVERIFPA